MTEALPKRASGGARRLELMALPGVPGVEPGDDLATIALDAVAAAGTMLADHDVLILAQKIVSKSEGRIVDLRDVTPSARAIEMAATARKDPRVIELVLAESRAVLRCRPGVIIVEHNCGFVLANAGIDASNVEGDERVLLLPADPDGSAAALRATLKRRAGVDVGIVINDSLGRAWRNGTIGTALGAAGLPGLVDLRGTLDLFGRELQSTEIGMADELAAAASLVMGQADEGQPIVLARGVPYPRREGRAEELIRPHNLDLFR